MSLRQNFIVHWRRTAAPEYGFCRLTVYRWYIRTIDMSMAAAWLARSEAIGNNYRGY